MPGPDGPWGDALVDAVRDGESPRRRSTTRCAALLRLAARVGALEGVAPAVAGAARAAGVDGRRALLREAAAAGTVLCATSRGVLPARPRRRCAASR